MRWSKTHSSGASTPISPPSGPTQWLFQGAPAESKLLAAKKSTIEGIIASVREWGIENGLFGDHPLPCLKDRVRITGNSIVHDLSHQAGPEKIESVAVLPSMLKNAVWVQTETSADAMKSHVLASKLEIAGRKITVCIVVRESNGKLFYDHELLTNKEGVPTVEQRSGVNVQRAQSEEPPSAGKVVATALAVKAPENPSLSLIRNDR